MELSNSEKAVEFLEQFIPNGLWVITAIHPETKNIETATFSAKTTDQAVDWIEDRNGVDNLYFSVNQPEQGDYSRKLRKDQVAVVHFFHVDVDPEKGKEIELQQKQIFDRLTVRRPEAVPRPTAIIKSGGGYQAFWALEEPGIVENDNQRGAYEEVNKWLEKQLGADNCFNLDRIMRLPWTMNLPTKLKRQAGRVEALAKVVQYEANLVHKFTDFDLTSDDGSDGDQDTPKPGKVDTGGLEAKIGEEIHEGPEYVEDITEFGEKYGIPRRFLHIIVEGEGDEEQKLKKQQAGKDLSRSEWLFDVVCELERRNVPRRLILGIIMEPNVEKFRISDSVINNKDYPSPLDYAVRQLRKAATTVAKDRLFKEQVADAVSHNTNIPELLYSLCDGMERPKPPRNATREEAEQLDPLLKAINGIFTNVANIANGKGKICSFYRKPEIGKGKTLGLNKVSDQDLVRQYPMTVVTGTSPGKGDNPGKPITAKVMEWWLKHRHANRKSRIVFAPEGTEENVLNEWKGFTYEADDSGKCDLFLTFIKDIICTKDEEYYNYVLDWCARMFQQPGEVGHVALILKGGSGIGKSFFAEKLGEMVVSNFYQTARIERLTSNFNAALKTTVLLFLDEPRIEKGHYDVVKKYLVSSTIDIEAKGYEQENVANCLHMVMAANHKQVVPADADDRRLFVLNISEEEKGNRSYFGAIEDQLDENDKAGYKALFHFFRTRDISKFKVTLIPQTIALEEQKDLALSMTAQWLLEKLFHEELGRGRWPNRITVKSLSTLYLKEVTERRGTKWDLSDSRELSKYFRETLGLHASSKIHAEDLEGKKEEGRGYHLPLIRDARKAWEKAYYPRTDWPEPENEVEQVPEPVEPETEVRKGRAKEDTPF